MTDERILPKWIIEQKFAYTQAKWISQWAANHHKSRQATQTTISKRKQAIGQPQLTVALHRLEDCIRLRLPGRSCRAYPGTRPGPPPPPAATSTAPPRPRCAAVAATAPAPSAAPRPEPCTHMKPS